MKFIKTGLTAIARQANDTKKNDSTQQIQENDNGEKTDQRPICKHKYILQGTTKINHDQCFANFNPPLAIEQEAMSYQPCNNSWPMQNVNMLEESEHKWSMGSWWTHNHVEKESKRWYELS